MQHQDLKPVALEAQHHIQLHKYRGTGQSAPMKKDLDHLPLRKQQELETILRIIFDEFEQGLAEMKPRNGKRMGGLILKIILFGSHARGDWVEDRISGYFSDFDILVIVNKDYVVEAVSLFGGAEDRIIRNPRLKTPTNIIVHTMAEVNQALSDGQYFFVDIRKEGIVLYERTQSERLKAPKPHDKEQAYRVAKEHYDHWMPSAEMFLEGAGFYQNKGAFNEAAFSLHQAAERAYHAILLVLTNYTPATHNLKHLRSLTESREERLRSIWPEDTRLARRRYELLKRAYIDARYSEHYKITEEELDYLAERMKLLHLAAREICEERLKSLK